MTPSNLQRHFDNYASRGDAVEIDDTYFIRYFNYDDGIFTACDEGVGIDIEFDVVAAIADGSLVWDSTDGFVYSGRSLQFFRVNQV